MEHNLNNLKVKGDFILKSISTNVTNKNIDNLINYHFPNSIKKDNWYSISQYIGLMNGLETNNLVANSGITPYNLGFTLVENIIFHRSAINFPRGCVLWNYIQNKYHADVLNSETIRNYLFLDLKIFDSKDQSYIFNYLSPYPESFIKGIIEGIMVKYRFNLIDFSVLIDQSSIYIQNVNINKFDYKENRLELK